MMARLFATRVLACNKAYCITNSLFSLAVTETIASIHYVYTRRDGQAELAWWVGLISKQYAPTNGGNAGNSNGP